MRARAIALAVAWTAAAGCGGDPAALIPSGAPDGGAPADAGPDAGAADAGPLELAALAGVWDVKGSDDRGDYSGVVEITDSTLLREISWTSATVEDGRALHWAFAGTLKQDGAAVALQASLDPRGFVSGRDGAARSLSDAPVVLTGAARRAGTDVDVAWTAQRETWTNRRPSSGAPPFTVDRREVPAHDPPSDDFRDTADALFDSFRKLPDVQPYVPRADFQAAIHQVVLDRTDFEFYRSNPNALRVIGKPIDPLSLLETRLRADAFRFTLAEKAQRFDKELQSDFIDPVAPIVPDSIVAGGAIQPSGDAALWNATYIASQWYRHQVTGEQEAFDHLVRSLEAELLLQELTGDWSQFARSIRRATGAAGGGWHSGAPSHPELEWLEGGNNDMFKGLVYSLAAGYFALCDGRDHALCGRIRANVKHLADDVRVGNGEFNNLLSTWLAAIALDSALDRSRYRAKAEAIWTAQKVIEKNSTLQYEQGISDWSGTHLNFVSAQVASLLAGRVDLGGDARDIFRGEFDRGYQSVKKQRLVMWDLAGGASEGAVDAVWILRELPFPKPLARIDHRVDPAFSLSPYPSLPWKNDWTVTDRTQSLRLYPLFELPANNYQWKSHMDFAGATEHDRNHGVDYLHAYWYGRRLGLISAGD